MKHLLAFLISTFICIAIFFLPFPDWDSGLSLEAVEESGSSVFRIMAYQIAATPVEMYQTEPIPLANHEPNTAASRDTQDREKEGTIETKQPEQNTPETGESSEEQVTRERTETAPVVAEAVPEAPATKAEALYLSGSEDTPSAQSSQATTGEENGTAGNSFPLPASIGAVPGPSDAPAAKPGVINYTPDYTENSPPTYPRAAKRMRQEGTVLLAITTDISGKIMAVTVEESSGFFLLDNAALKAVNKWDFSGIIFSDTLNTIRTEIEFRLEEK